MPVLFLPGNPSTQRVYLLGELVTSSNRRI
jgi:hypothetical protein